MPTMAPTLSRTEAEEPKSDQRRQPRTAAMNASRINEEARQNAVTAPANVQTQRVDDCTTPATHHASEDAHDHVAAELRTATTRQHENQATVPTLWSRFLSPIWRMVHTTQPPQIPDYQMPQSEVLSLLGESKTAQDQLLEQQELILEQQELILEQQQALKTREEQLNATVEETLREQFQEVVGQGFAGLLRNELQKVIKQEYRRKQVKEEKAAGKPKKKKHMYNIHVEEESKRLKGLKSEEGSLQVAAMTWRMLSKEERMRLYGDKVTLDKERYEREMEGWWEERRNPIDEKKPAAKPTPEELAATAVTDPSQEPHQPPHEVPIAAAAGPDASDEGYQRSLYEQQVQDNIARNQERMRSLGLLSTTGVENKSTSNATSKKRKMKKRKNTSDQSARRSPRKLRHNLLDNDRSDGSTEFQQCSI